jgi:transaldolase
MSKTYFKRVLEMTGTDCWINNPTREEALKAIDAGMTNCTTNPTFAMKQIQREPDLLNPIIERICKEEPDDNRAAVLIQRECVSEIMDVFSSVFDSKNRMHGLVSIQGDPILEDDSQIIIDEALACQKSLGPNYLAKIPTTFPGLIAMEEMIKNDIPFIATEIMSISQMVSTCELYKRISAETGKTPPLFVTHITGIFDDHMQNVIKEQNIDISPDIAFQAGVAVGRKLYRLFKERNYPGVILGGGARGSHHFTEFVGGDMSITINWKNSADQLLEQNPPVIERIKSQTPDYVLDELCAKIPDFKLAWEEDALNPEEFGTYGPVILFRKAFTDGWEFLLEEISKRR